MGDTGLDVGSCMFRDDAVPVPTTLAGGLQHVLVCYSSDTLFCTAFCAVPVTLAGCLQQARSACRIACRKTALPAMPPHLN